MLLGRVLECVYWWQYTSLCKGAPRAMLWLRRRLISNSPWRWSWEHFLWMMTWLSSASCLIILPSNLYVANLLISYGLSLKLLCCRWKKTNKKTNNKQTHWVDPPVHAHVCVCSWLRHLWFPGWTKLMYVSWQTSHKFWLGRQGKKNVIKLCDI